VTPGEPQIDRATGAVRVRIAVREGPRWQVTALQFAIADGGEAPAGIAGERTGRPWTSLWRQDTLTAIRRWYFTRGHPDVQVTLAAQTFPAADGSTAVTVTARVVPGPEVRVGRVRFAGNARTRDATLRRLVPVQPGALLDPIKFNDSQARISQLGVFRSVDLRYDPAAAATCTTWSRAASRKSTCSPAMAATSSCAAGWSGGTTTSSAGPRPTASSSSSR
jgi:translocation and assembly module TamA